MAKNYQQQLQKIEQRKIQSKVEEMLIRGVTNRNDIAARLGLGVMTVYQHVSAILDRWQLENLTRLKDMRAQAIRRLEKSASLAMTSYERSRKDEEEVSTTSQAIQCPACKGTGMQAGTEDWCKSCKGKGEIVQEVVKRRVKGQAGEAAHLRVYFDSVRKVARLQGLYVNRDPRSRPKASGEAPVVLEGGSIGGIDLTRVSTALLLSALSAYDQMMESAKTEIKTIDVESKEG